MAANIGGQKNLIVILLLIIIFLIGVIVWLFGRPGLGNIKAAGGKTKYIVAVGEVGDLEIYSPDGVRWDTCVGDSCKRLFPPERLIRDTDGYQGFLVASRNDIRPTIEPKGSFLDALIQSAFAQPYVRDGNCPVAYVEWIENQVSLRYPTPDQDPDCPP
ncbi:hypothetical protein DWB84_02340 [Saccharophagus sp. K07]|jgi:hypothetical protein|uniref:hypothetical protein n=1 Tax=Saccharophagus sp. K07 TaxID=2283636 RepID=UPI001651F377|nr:hypothetical protein [Saccharophagus sp. K07]MBC6904308.1 hypothetical protein [Saccharophagus sp. K07]